MPPPPPPFAPTPLPNIGQSGKQPKGYSTTVKIEGQPVAIRGATFGSSGDIASRATGGGIVSSNAEGPTKFIGPGSLNVKIESKNVQLLGDQMLNNCGPTGSPPNSATMMGAVHAPLMVVMLPEDRPQDKCDACSPKPGSRADVERKPYDDFFSADERAAFDALAAETPDLVAMLARKSGKYAALPLPGAKRAELGRFVLLDDVPANGESWFLARTWELARAQGFEAIVSHADPAARATVHGSVVFPGHVGTIYQATDAVYVGRTRRRTWRVFRDGSVLSARAMSKLRKKERGWQYVVEQLMAHGASAPVGAIGACGASSRSAPPRERSWSATS